MSQRGATHHSMRKRAGGRTVGKVILLSVALCLTASGLTLAGLGRLGARYTAAPSLPAPLAPVSLSPTSPSKEYVYAGGRLVATEEPALTPPAAPTNLRVEEYTETTPKGWEYLAGYRLRWDDNATNEAGYQIEHRELVNGQWAAWAPLTTLGANLTTYFLGTSRCNFELFRVRATNALGDSAYSNEQYVSILNCYWDGGPPSCTQATPIIVSEFRLRGAAGARDEFIELYNNSDGPTSVCTNDGSGGWTLAARTASGASASPVFTVPNGTVIPARGHYLAVNASPAGGYSLSAHPAGSGTTATGDLTYNTDIEDDSGIALFKTANPANFNAANRLDAAGFAGAAGAVADLYREGGGLTPVGTQNGEYSFYRTATSASGYVPKDTGSNATDFLLVSTLGSVFSGVQSTLGTPGPENLSSPPRRDATVVAALLDPAVGSAAPPNRARDFTVGSPNYATFGTMSMRRTVTNYTGAPVTRIRFRVVDITTYPSGGLADLRAISSGSEVLMLSSGQVVTVQGTTVEEPPTLLAGGGYNSTLTLTLAQPLAPGASANVQLTVGIQRGGSFRFIVSVEALP